MTFIAVPCPHCHSEQIVKRGTLLLDSGGLCSGVVREAQRIFQAMQK